MLVFDIYLFHLRGSNFYLPGAFYVTFTLGILSQKLEQTYAKNDLISTQVDHHILKGAL